MNDSVNRLVQEALAARRAGDATTERRLLEQAAEQAPDAPQLHNALGMNALAVEDFARAERHFGRATTLDPSEPILWLNRATALRRLEDYEGERAALDTVLSLDRGHPVANVRLAELLERRGDTIAAAQSWAAVVQLAATMPQRPASLDAAVLRGQSFLQSHARTLGAAIDDNMGAAIAQLGPDARRLNACIDHLLGRRRIYTNECAGLHYPFLPADEFFDRSLFPWFAELEARTPAIRREVQALVTEGVGSIRPYVRQDSGTPSNKWSALDNSYDWSACFLWEYGVRNDDVCARCPETVAALTAIPQTDIPGKAPTAFFSILKPGAVIPPHTGVTNTRTIVHLPLIVPEGCRFRVGGETRPWREGEAFAFDDTIEHEAWNSSAEPRIVLIFDVWNPHLTADEQALLKELFRITGQGGVAP